MGEKMTEPTYSGNWGCEYCGMRNLIIEKHCTKCGKSRIKKKKITQRDFMECSKCKDEKGSCESCYHNREAIKILKSEYMRLKEEYVNNLSRCITQIIKKGTEIENLQEALMSFNNVLNGTRDLQWENLGLSRPLRPITSAEVLWEEASKEVDEEEDGEK
jgi:hypothetical protein